MTIFDRQDYERISRQCVRGVQYLPRLKSFMSCDNRVRGKDNLNPFTTMMNDKRGGCLSSFLGVSLQWVSAVRLIILFWTIDDLFMMTSSVWSFLEIFLNFWRYHIFGVMWHHVTSRDMMWHYVTLSPRYDIVLFDTYCLIKVKTLVSIKFNIFPGKTYNKTLILFSVYFKSRDITHVSGDNSHHKTWYLIVLN